MKNKNIGTEDTELLPAAKDLRPAPYSEDVQDLVSRLDTVCGWLSHLEHRLEHLETRLPATLETALVSMEARLGKSLAELRHQSDLAARRTTDDLTRVAEWLRAQSARWEAVRDEVVRALELQA